MKRFLRIIFAGVLLSTIVNTASAANYYWRSNPVNNNFNNPSNWETAPGGGISPGSYPSLNDDVFFPATSSITLINSGTGVMDMRSLTMANATTTYSLLTGTVNIGGNIVAYNNLTFGGSAVGLANAPASPTDVTIDMGTNAVTNFGRTLYVNKPGYKVTLAGHDLNTNTMLNLHAGTLATNGFNLTVGSITVGGSAAAPITLDITGSTLTTTNIQFNGAVGGAADTNYFYFYNVTYTLSNSTVNLANPIIRFATTPSNYTINFNNLNFVATSATTVSANYDNNLMPGDLTLVANNLGVSTPSLNFTILGSTTIDREMVNVITVNNTLNINVPTTITLDNIYPFRNGTTLKTAQFNLNNVAIAPTGCNQQSMLVAKTPLIVNFANSIVTNNLAYEGIQFTGGPLSAPKSDDAGGNSGTVTWTATAAKDYYWVGDNGFWSDASHWASTSGGVGGSAGGCIPTAADNVFVDNNSFSASGQAITLSASAACNNITWNDGGREGSFKATDKSLALAINGSADFSGVATKGVNPSLFFYGSGTIKSAVDTTYLSPQIKIQASGTYTLTIDMISARFVNPYQPNASVGGTYLLHFGGGFSSGGYKIDLGTVQSISVPTGSVTRTLDLSNSQVYTYCNTNSGGASAVYAVLLDKVGLTSYNLAGSHIHIDAPPSSSTEPHIKLLNSSAASPWVMGDVTFQNTVGTAILEMNGAGALANAGVATIRNLSLHSDYNETFGPTITVDSLYIVPNRVYSFANSRTFTINKGVGITVGCGQSYTIQSNNGTQKATLKGNYSPFLMPNAQVKNIIASGNTLTVADGVDLGGNTNVAITPATAKTFYWVGDSGNWSDTNHWSLTSGGAPSGCVPSVNDTVYFDKNSFSATGQTVNLNVSPVTINTMIWTDEAGAMNPIFKNDASLGAVYVFNLNGSLRLANGMTMNMYDIGGQETYKESLQFHFKGTNTAANSQYIDPKNVNCKWVGFYSDGTGRYDLLNNLSLCSTFNFQTGSLYTHGKNVTASYYINIKQAGTNTVDISNSTLTAWTHTYTVANCAYWNSAGTNLIQTNGAYDIGIYNACPVSFNNVTNNKGIISRTVQNGTLIQPVTFNKITLTNAGETLNGQFVTDTIAYTQLASTHFIQAGTTLTINQTVNSASTPCAYMALKSTDLSTGGVKATVKSGNCNLLLPYFTLLNIQGDTSCPATAYQTYGADLGGNSNVTFAGIPSPTINFPDTIIACQNLPYNLKVNVYGLVTSYKWSKNGTVISGATTNALLVTSVGKYQLDVTYAGVACASIYRQNVTAIIDTIKPKLDVPKDVTMCRSFTNSGTALDPISVTDNCNFNRLWYTLSGAITAGPIKKSTLDGVAFKKGVTTVTWFANDTIPTTWYSGTTPTPNVTSASFNVTVIDNAAPSTTDVAYCQNATASALSVPTISGQTAQWYTVSTGGTASATAPTPSTTTVGTTIYYVSYKDDATGCESDRAALKVTINPTPVIITSVSQQTICSGETAAITFSSSVPATINWTADDGTSGTGNFSAAKTNAGSTPITITYTITGVTTNGCTSPVETGQVIVNPKPLLVVTNPTSVCAPNTVDITATAVTDGSAAGLILSYYTDALATNLLINPTAVTTSGTYYIKGQDATTGCYMVQPVLVTINNCAADLSITKCEDSSTPIVGSVITFTVTLTNNGPGNATNIKVQDKLPSGYQYISDNSASTGTSYNYSTGIWTIGALANKGVIVLTIQAKVL